MALTLKWQTAQGVTLPDAYLRVMAFSGNSKYVQYSVQVWSNEQARQEERAIFEERNFSFEYPPDGLGDILKACYLDLKKQAGLEDAVDV